MDMVTSGLVRSRVQGASLASGLDAEAAHALDSLLAIQAGVRKRHVLYRATAPFSVLYVIRVGTFKTLMLAEDGREQVVGYHMAGDILGLDGIGNDDYACEAVALEDSEVRALPFAKLDELARREPVLRRNLYRLLSDHLRRGRDMMVLLASLSAEERVAAFLLDLARRYRQGGYSASEFTLRMTREEIASFLGLQLETVSRVFSRLHGDRIVDVGGRAIRVIDEATLVRLAGNGP